MKQIADIAKEAEMAGVMVELTSAFEGIASTRIAQVKDQVLRSTEFFGDLWRIYTQIRVDELFRFGRSQNKQVNPKELWILITSEGGFSGDIDQRLVKTALAQYDPNKQDIVIIGHHGLVQLSQRKIPVIKSFRLPLNDQNINVRPLIDEVQKYSSTMVYYTAYISLMNQEIKTIKLGTAVTQKGSTVKKGEEVISEANYIFEPSTHAVVDHLESSMMEIMLSEVILESKLAQYASRFRAMRVAHERADDTHAELNWAYNRARRQSKDERLKEVMNGLRGSKKK
jgi:ATP synthase F1 gamma subunit